MTLSNYFTQYSAAYVMHSFPFCMSHLFFFTLHCRLIKKVNPTGKKDKQANLTSPEDYESLEVEETYGTELGKTNPF